MPSTISEFKLNPLDGSTTVEYSDGSVTTGSILPASTLTADDTARVRAGLNRPGPLRLHVYGCSLDASDNFWRNICAASGGRFTLEKNSGMGGFRADQVLAKMQAEGISSTADVVAFGEGTNDAMSGRTTAQHIADMKAMLKIIAAAGKGAVVRLPPPTENGWYVQANKNALADIVLCEQTGALGIDPYSKWCDTDGTYTAGFSTDNTHPTAANYGEAAKEAAALLLNRPQPYMLPRGNVGQGLIQSNVLQITDTNADNLADGWNALGMSSPTYNAATNYAYPWRGKKNSVSVSQTANASIYKEMLTGWAVGDRLRLTGVFGVPTAPTNMNAMLFIRAVRTAGNVEQYAAYTAGQMDDSYVATELVVPDGTTAIQVWIRWIPLTAAAYSGTIEFGGIDVYNITANTF
jgi:hypothetical protein